ncbi:MAG TPA: hypothetical protein VFY36_03935 [Solirubrobacteraceae bacterium]|nr:hypothetical protein [Solirubrobacteraceae bacterium]
MLTLYQASHGLSDMRPIVAVGACVADIDDFKSVGDEGMADRIGDR